MKKFILALRWDQLLLFRYNILPAALFAAMAYLLALTQLPSYAGSEKWIAFLIFSDPTALGFIFIGAMVLFEKDNGTLQVLRVCPLQAWQYLGAKALSLTLLAVPITLVMAWAGRLENLNWLMLITAVVLSSLFFVLVGFISVSRTKTLNQYILIVPWVLIPLFLPVLDYFDVYSNPLFYLLPTHASLLLFRASIGTISIFDLVYALLYLPICIWGVYRLATYHQRKYSS